MGRAARLAEADGGRAGYVAVVLVLLVWGALAALALALVLSLGGGAREAAAQEAGTSGEAVAWGFNGSGQTDVPAGAQSDVKAVAAGANFNLALREDGSVVAWGSNFHGQTDLPAGAQSDVRAIAAGASHSLALKEDGSVVAWGRATEGQTNVPAGAQSGVRAIAAGPYHSLALREDGSVVAWGGNFHGQTDVPAGAQSDVKAVAGGYSHSLALKEDGSVVAWGDNTIEGRTDVPAGAQSGVRAIAGGYYHSLALREDGSVVAWGSNDDGQTDVPAGAQSGVRAVAGGGEHSLALREDGSVVAWGRATEGQTNVPAGAQSGVRAIASGYFHNVALKVPTPPRPVDFFEADAGEGRALLSWSNPSDPDFLAVRVLRSTTGSARGPSPNADQVQVYEGTGESFEDTGLQNGTTYYYTAFARDDTGLWSARATERATPADATGPSVGATGPASGAKRVTIGANVTATFSEAMEASSLTGSAFKLVKAGTRRAVPATVGYDPETKKATLDPSAKLARGTRYKATVTTGAEDLAGNTLDQSPTLAGEQPKVWFFATAR